MTVQSLAFKNFAEQHRNETDIYWRLAASTSYAVRYWSNIPLSDQPKTIAEKAHDIFEKHITLSPEDFCANQAHVIIWARAFTLVAIVTNFETYLRQIIQSNCSKAFTS